MLTRFTVIEIDPPFDCWDAAQTTVGFSVHISRDITNIKGSLTFTISLGLVIQWLR